MLMKIVAIAALLIAPNVPVAVTNSDLQDRYVAAQIAMARHDGAALQGLLSPDFKSIDLDGQSESAAELISAVQTRKIQGRDEKVQMTPLSMNIVGNTADVEAVNEITTQEYAAGQAHAVHVTVRSHDVWKRVGTSWLLALTRAEQMDVAVDGKTVDHKSATY